MHAREFEQVRMLFRMIDSVVELPPAEEAIFQAELAKMQQEETVPYLSTMERLAVARGERNVLLESLPLILELKYGAAGLVVWPELQAIADVAKLKTILQAIRTTETIDELRKLWS